MATHPEMSKVSEDKVKARNRYTKFGRFTSDIIYYEDSKMLAVTQTLEFKTGRFPSDEYDEYRDFAKSVSRLYDGRVVLVRKLD